MFNMASSKGIDVSKYQGDIDWKEVKKWGAEFVIVRAGDGIHVDPNVHANIYGAKKVGLKVGVYLYVRFSPVTSAEKQISNLLESSKGLVIEPTLDVETLDGMAPTTVINTLREMRRLIKERINKIPILYTAHGFWNSLPPSELDGAFSLWVANWEVQKPTLPRGWKKYLIWQYSEKGEVPGIHGKVDLNLWNGNVDWYGKFPGATVTGAAAGLTIAGPPGALVGGMTGYLVDKFRPRVF